MPAFGPLRSPTLLGDSPRDLPERSIELQCTSRSARLACKCAVPSFQSRLHQRWAECIMEGMNDCSENSYKRMVEAKERRMSTVEVASTSGVGHSSGKRCQDGARRESLRPRWSRGRRPKIGERARMQGGFLCCNV